MAREVPEGTAGDDGNNSSPEDAEDINQLQSDADTPNKSPASGLAQVMARMKGVLQHYKHTTTALQNKCNA